MTYIPLRTERRKLIPLREDAIIKGNEAFLNEAVHAFSKQYLWARKCALLIYEAIEKGRGKLNVAFKGLNDDSIQGASISIRRNNILKTSASISGIDERGYVQLDIFPKQNILNSEKNGAISEIYDAIAHELSHGNLYWRRYASGVSTDITPTDYEKWITVMRNASSYNSIEYLFCYALYSTAPQEIQAFVSQTYTQLMSLINAKYGSVEKITKKEFLSLIVRTNTSQTYKTNIILSEKLLTANEETLTRLHEKLAEFGINYSAGAIRKKLREIRHKSEDALKMAYNNAYYYAEKYLIDEVSR